MTDSLPALSLEGCVLENGGTGFVVKIQTESAELNVWLSAGELADLSSLLSADWTHRRSLRSGVSGGASVFWCSDENGISVLVGSDDETWDFGIFLPAESSQEILALANGQ